MFLCPVIYHGIFCNVNLGLVRLLITWFSLVGCWVMDGGNFHEG